jgi:uncharacterized OB-fold protein
MDSQFHSQLKTKKSFLEGLKRGEILFSQCEKCSQKYLPPREICKVCGSKSLALKPVDLSHAKVVACTFIQVPPERYSNEEGYGIAVVEFKDKLRLLGRLNTALKDPIKIVGLNVKVVVEKSKPDFWFEL